MLLPHMSGGIIGVIENGEIRRPEAALSYGVFERPDNDEHERSNSAWRASCSEHHFKVGVKSGEEYVAGAGGD